MSKRNVLLVAVTLFLCSSCIETQYKVGGQQLNNIDIIYFYILIVSLFLNEQIRDWCEMSLLLPEARLAFICGFVLAPCCGYIVAPTDFSKSENLNYICGYIACLGIVYNLGSWAGHRYFYRGNGIDYLDALERVDMVVNWLTYLLIAISGYHIYTMFCE